ncbi:diguanylate cyclase domain-containing protein [Agromyces seonyuensis]|uniref:Diguanylate cyclase n=1 Tax=Agromyces seonyuensis TaxID=2662446 RepID=A0A6I4P5E7_9MICO|nr:diguanylate cyclase [Agromyces seonyuensis]MWB98747.1 diguanylate cyclase [Agromyces seonyuensis]
MNVDVGTVQLAATVVTAVCGGLFLIDAFLRRPDLAGRYWALMYVAAMLASIAYSIWHLRSDVSWVGRAIGHAAAAAAPLYLWSGARAANRRPRTFGWLAPIAAVAVLGAVFADGPEADEWAGAIVLSIAVAAGALLAALEFRGGDLGGNPTARSLSIFLLFAVGYSLLRPIAYLIRGPDEFVVTWFGSATTGLGYIAVVIVTTVTIVQMQSVRLDGSIGGRADRRSLTTEMLDEASFEALARDQLDRGTYHRVQLVLMDIEIDDRETLQQAYGRGSVEVFLAESTASLRRSAPPGAVIGHASTPGEYRMLLPGPSIEAVVERARAIQAGLRDLDEPGEVGVTLTASIGLAGTDAAGYDYDELVAAARRAVTEAQAEGGDEVVVAARGEGA